MRLASASAAARAVDHTVGAVVTSDAKGAAAVAGTATVSDRTRRHRVDRSSASGHLPPELVIRGALDVGAAVRLAAERVVAEEHVDELDGEPNGVGQAARTSAAAIGRRR
jgi:hypothetical protein